MADIYALCERLVHAGITINRPPREGPMAFVRAPDHISIELRQKGGALAPREPWPRCRTRVRGERAPDQPSIKRQVMPS
ncbi:MAG: hypothetical protein M5U08_02495 [Burkholderiales bacterium]|nr:hypothetical protein [Burkholderiales bacterium]